MKETGPHGETVNQGLQENLETTLRKRRKARGRSMKALIKGGNIVLGD